MNDPLCMKEGSGFCLNSAVLWVSHFRQGPEFLFSCTWGYSEQEHRKGNARRKMDLVLCLQPKTFPVQVAVERNPEQQSNQDFASAALNVLCSDSTRGKWSCSELLGSQALMEWMLLQVGGGGVSPWWSYQFPRPFAAPNFHSNYIWWSHMLCFHHSPPTNRCDKKVSEPRSNRPDALFILSWKFVRFFG